MVKLLVRVLFVIEGLLLLGSLGHAQSFVLDLPRPSQHAVLTQRIGITDITINYHRPLVNKRKVWGGLVPYGQVWRCRSQRKYDDRVYRSGDHRGQAPAQGNLRPAHDSRRKRVDGHFLQELNFLGQLHLRPGRGCASSHGESHRRQSFTKRSPTTSTM